MSESVSKTWRQNIFSLSFAILQLILQRSKATNMFVSSTKWNFILAYENKLDKEFRELKQQKQNRYLGSGQRKRHGKLTNLLIMWNLYEIIHICTAVIDESKKWSWQ